MEARRLYRGRPHEADLRHSSHCCLITTVKWLGREPSSYPLDLSNASESGGQSLSRAMRVFSAYSAYSSEKKVRAILRPWNSHLSIEVS